MATGDIDAADRAKRSRAAKLGWATRRRRRREQAEADWRRVKAQAEMLRFQGQGVDARLLGDVCVVVDAIDPPGVFTRFVPVADWFDKNEDS